MADSDTRLAALAVVARTPALLSELLASLPESTVRKANEEGWSPKDVVAHLIDTDAVAFRGRIGRIVSEDRPRIEPIEPSERLDEGGFRERDLTSLLEELSRERRESIAAIGALTPDRLARSGDHAEVGEITAENLVHYWACHDLTHLRQVEGILRDSLAGHVGNMSKYLEED
jgi:hypothetical protein